MLRTIFAAFLGVCGLANAAYAGGFTAARFGGEHGHAAADHPTSLYFNPAGLSLGVGTRLYIEGLFVYRTAEYDRPEAAIDNPGGGTPDDAIDANAGTARLSNNIIAPFVGVVSDLGVPNLGVGLGLYAPFGGQAEWDQNPDFADNDMYPGAVDGVQRWAVIEGQQRALYVTLAGAYRLPGPRLSFGLGVNLVRLETDTIRARTVAGTDDLVAGTTLVEGRSLLDVTATTFSVGAGVIWQPIDALHVGLSYQSQPGFGEVELAGNLRNRFGNGPESDTAVIMTQSLPDIVRLAARYEATPEVELRLSADYQRWSVFDKQCVMEDSPDSDCALTATGGVGVGAQGVIVNIPRDWQDTYSVRGGVSFWVNPRLETTFGLAFDSNAVPDENIDPALMDMSKVVAGLGARMILGDGTFEITANVNEVFYFEREVDARDRDDMGDAIAPDSPSRNPDGGGVYNQNILLGSLALQANF